MDSKKSFKVGEEDRELFFSYAVQQRLFGAFSVDRFQEYMLDPNFTVRALGLLLLGKVFKTCETVDDIIDKIEDMGLTDDQSHAIMMWVRQRTLNFTQKEIESVKAQVQELLPHLQQMQAQIGSTSS